MRRGAVEEGDTRKLREELEAAVEGEVDFGPSARALYATDASNYRQPPIGVVVPRTVDDVVAATDVCRRHGAPLLTRGGGTSLGGQCTNRAVVIDTSRWLRSINWVDPDRRLASVQPGVVLDDLRAAVRPHGLTFGPDPATHNRCTLGGIIGNNACGVHAQVAGRASENIDELDVLLYDGTRMRLRGTPSGELDRIVAEPGRRGDVYRGLRQLADDYGDDIRRGFPDLPRRVSGFPLEKLLPENGFHLAQALVGTEGTCATVLDAVVRLVPAFENPALAVLGFPDVFSAGDAVPEVLRYEPTAVEGVDGLQVDYMRRKALHLENLPLLPDGHGWLLVEFTGESAEESEAKARRMLRDLGGGRWPVGEIYTDPGAAALVWEVREAGLGATAHVPARDVAHPGWEDSAVPPDRLGGYLRDLHGLFSEYGYEAALYGHFGHGCVHCRIDFELDRAGGVETFRSFLDDAADLVVSYGGSLSGEHGDGQARGELLERMYGGRLVEAFRRFKGIWDPDGKMNPGKVVDPLPVTSDLRLGPDYAPARPATAFRFPRDGGSFARATERCVGVGLCRRDDGHGTMCPSYMVTHEEKHSTRGRAHLLNEMMRGDLVEDGWRSDEVKEALDLCLACKGCKSDCPVDVDIATYKAEFLSHYYRRRLRPRQAYSLGLIHRWAPVGSRLAPIVNLLTAVPPLSAAAKAAAGIAPERPIPRFATESLVEWFRKRRPQADGGRPDVLVWPDTFTTFLEPEHGKATVEVLEAAGYRVRIPDGSLCCGRPLYDFGMLDEARSLLARILERLREDIRAGTPLVVVEPSCLAVFRDELVELFPDDRDARRLAAQTYSVGEFLRFGAPDLDLPRRGGRALVQVHCHERAVTRPQADEEIYERLGMEAEYPDAGCCGMAGSFGYERGEKYEVSVAVGERKLAPLVREADPETVIVADGFSCRNQISQLTGRRAVHLADVLAEALGDEETAAGDGTSGAGPRVALGAAVAAAAAGAVWRAARRRG